MGVLDKRDTSVRADMTRDDSPSPLPASGEHATLVPLDGGTTLTEAAYRALKADIVRARRAPGERLRIERLRRLYGIGPTPLREALQRLAADGFVLAEDRRGFRVAPLDARELIDLNVARTALETRALALSIERGDARWEAEVVAATYLLGKADDLLAGSTPDDLDEWELLNRRFHDALVSACGSSWLLRLRGMLNDQVERYRRASVFAARVERDLHAEHEAIAQAALARDGGRACELVAAHFDRTAQGVLDLMRGDRSSRSRAV